MKKFLGLFVALSMTFVGLSIEEDDHGAGHQEKEKFNAGKHAVHHALDSYEFHFWGEGESSVSIPLPVILWTDNGLVTFMSSEFHHDDNGVHAVERKGMSFVKLHGAIYQLDAGSDHIGHAEDGSLTGGKEISLDFSLTKNVVTIFLIAIILIWMMFRSAKKYKKGTPSAPSGVASWTEPVVLFVRDVAKDNIEGDKYKKFTPYLLTVFFFILIGNILGLIPFITNPNVTGSISITLMLAMFTFGIQLLNSKRNYWTHIVDPLGKSMPWGGKFFLYLIMWPVEIAGIFIKPVALMIRLFANITAGHIIVVSLISIIFLNESFAWSALSVPFTLFISILEILVAFLQAYIFTMLSAMFIGMAVETSHH